MKNIKRLILTNSLVAVLLGALFIIISEEYVTIGKAFHDSFFQLGIAFIIATLTFHIFQYILKLKDEDYLDERIKKFTDKSLDFMKEQSDKSLNSMKNINKEIQDIRYNLFNLLDSKKIIDVAKSASVNIVQIYENRRQALSDIYSEI